LSGLVSTDADGRVLTFNRAASAITGLPVAQALGHDVGEVLQLPSHVRSRLDALADGRSNRADLEYRTGDGRAIDLGVTATTLAFPDGRAGYLFTFQDVTTIKRLERDARLQQRLAAVGEMAAGIAHEIRNPLASMSGSIQVLRQELPLSDDQAQLMDIVLRESERLNDTIRSFLAYARPQKFAVARLDICKVVTDAAILLRNSSEARDTHTVDVKVPPTAVWYEADENQVRQIVWNIATNGLRAMPSGGRLLLSVEADHASPQDEVVISVQDEGRGIPAEELDGIFQPYRSSFERGTGLGLAIVHRIVSDYGGVIQVSSTVGVGTTVRVRLPVHATDSVPVAAASASARRQETR
jgi:two-component system sensor histidine kinase PilS (NtrC family)